MRQINLAEEDSYNDSNCADYETMEYADAAEEGTKDFEEEECQNTAREPEEIPDYDIYHCAVPVKEDEEMKALFGKLAETMRTGTNEEKQEAGETACLHLRGVVYKFLKGPYRTYVERDSTFEDDLVNAAFEIIIRNLAKYDSTLAVPSTFFYPYINSALSLETNRMKHSMRSPDATLKRKIIQIRKKYKEKGIVPTEMDYCIETGASASKIRSILRMLSRDMDTHLEAIADYDALIEGDPYVNSAFRNPETIVIEKTMYQGLVNYIQEHFTEEECAIYFEHVLLGTGITELAKKHNVKGTDEKVRRIIETINHNVKYNADMRRLVSGYVKSIPDESEVFTILPLQGEEDNMDLLEVALA